PLGLASALAESCAGASEGGGAATSTLTSEAGLSSRNPLNDAWRTLPSPGQPADSISATSLGLAPFTFAAFPGASVPLNGLVALSTARSLARSVFSTAAPKPVPHRPTYFSSPPR